MNSSFEHVVYATECAVRVYMSCIWLCAHGKAHRDPLDGSARAAGAGREVFRSKNLCLQSTHRLKSYM